MTLSKYQEIIEELKEYPTTKLLAVSKTRSVDQILELFQNGQREFGENRVDELVEKSKLIKEKINWHYIGRLQTNKVSKLFSVENLVAIHSVDRIDLVKELIKKEKLLNHELKIFLQFNTSEEEEKAGFSSVDQLVEAVDFLKSSKNLKFYGLMTMGKIRTDNPLEDAKICFKRLNNIKNTLIKQGISSESIELSMGMSGDYKIALEEGSNMIRVGSALFSS